MAYKNSRIGWLYIVIASVLIGLIYYLGWKSGCIFDGKQGIGDFDSSQNIMFVAYSCSLLILVFSSLGIKYIMQWSWHAFVSLLFLSAFGASPILFAILWTAESSGSRACGP